MAGLRDDLAESQTTIKVKREHLDTSQQALEESKQCTICSDRDVNVTLSPCGHTMCRECNAGLRSRQCPYCQG